MHLIEYVHRLIELADKPVWSLANYNNIILHEDGLRSRIGIRHDLADADGQIYLKIDRLRRTDPPEPPSEARDWLTVGRDPFKEPIVQSLRTAVMTAAETDRLIAQGAIDRDRCDKYAQAQAGRRSCAMLYSVWIGFRTRKQKLSSTLRMRGLIGHRPNDPAAKPSTSMTGSSVFSRR